MNFTLRTQLIYVTLLLVFLLFGSSMVKYLLYQRPLIIAEQQEAERKELLKRSLEKKANASVEIHKNEFCKKSRVNEFEEVINFWMFGSKLIFPGLVLDSVNCSSDSCNSSFFIKDQKKYHKVIKEYVSNIVEEYNVQGPDEKIKVNFDERQALLNVNGFDYKYFIGNIESESCIGKSVNNNDVKLFIEEIRGISSLYREGDLIIEDVVQNRLGYKHSDIVRFEELAQQNYVLNVDIYAKDVGELFDVLGFFKIKAGYEWMVSEFRYPVKHSRLKGSQIMKVRLSLLMLGDKRRDK